MNRYFSTMKTNVGSDVQDTSSAMLSLIGEYLNDRYVEVLRRLNLLDTARLNYTFNTVGGTEDYVMPDDFGKEVSVYDKTNNQPLGRITIQEWVRDYGHEQDTQGSVYKYLIVDSPVKTQPSSAGTVSVVSSSASDTTQSIYVKGILADGTEDYETIALNGTTTATGTKSFARILMLSKTAVTAGSITVTRGSDTLSVMGRNRSVSRYKLMRLIQIPSGVATIELTYIQKVVPLHHDYDYLTIECEDVVEAGAKADAWRYKRQFAKAQEFDGIFEKRLASLAWDYENQPNQIHTFNPKPYSRETV